MFGSNKSSNEKTFKPGGFLGNVKVTIDDNFVKYRGAYGDQAIVPRKALQTISISPNGWGKSDLIFSGGGTELARVSKMPTTWAEKTMSWLYSELGL